MEAKSKEQKSSGSLDPKGDLKGDGFEKLPVELWAKVLSRFRVPLELVRLELVSRRFRSIIIQSCWTQIRHLQTKRDQNWWSNTTTFLISLDEEPQLKLPYPYPKHQVFPLLKKLCSLKSISIDHADDAKFLKRIEAEHVETIWICIPCLNTQSKVPQLIRRASENLKELSIKFSHEFPTETLELQQTISQCPHLESLSYESRSLCDDSSDVLSQVLTPGHLLNLKKLKLVLELNRKSSGSVSKALLNSSAWLEELTLLTTFMMKQFHFFNVCSQKAKCMKSHSLQTLRKLSIEDIVDEDDDEMLGVALLKTCPQLQECQLPLLTKQQIVDTIPNYIKAVLSTGSRELKILAEFASMEEEDEIEDAWVEMKDLVQAQFPAVTVSHSEDGSSAVFQYKGASAQLVFNLHPSDSVDSDDLDAEDSDLSGQ